MIDEDCIDVICEQAADNALQLEGLTASDRDLIAAVLGTKVAIGALASAFSMSREGFTRRFTRATGMTPHAYRLAARLNDARELLGAGLTPATAAADAGFADQSHLGRHFRAAFGTTPAGYRTAMRA
jgi:transcriptional regulator GlxA family with amidase domain